MSNYPAGAEHDPYAPYNQPNPEEVNVEVEVRLGLFIKVYVDSEDDIKEAVEDEIYSKFKTDDVEINSITIYQHDFPNK